MQANYSTYDLVKLEQSQRLAALERRRLVRDHRAEAGRPKQTPVHRRPLTAAHATVATVVAAVAVLATLLAATA